MKLKEKGIYEKRPKMLKIQKRFFPNRTKTEVFITCQNLPCKVLGVLLLIACLGGGFIPVVRAQDPAPALVGDQIAVVGARGVVLNHSLTQQPLAELAPGALLTVQARSADGQLLYVQSETRQLGWVAAGDLLVVDVSNLPVMTAPVMTAPVMTPENGASVAVTETITQAVLFLPATLTGSAGDALAGAVTALVTLRDSRLNLRSGPGVAYPVVTKAEPGSRWAVVGRNATTDWLQLRAVNGRDRAWAAASYLQIEGDTTTLPLITELPPPPEAIDRTLMPTPAADSAPTIIALSATPEIPPAAPAAVGAVVRGKTGLSGTLVFQDRIGGTIYVYDLGQDTLRSITGGIDPALSPDGRQIAFTRDGGSNGLYVINLDGSDERLIYNERPLLRAPTWSPDGQWIAFSRSNGYDDCRILRGSVCVPDEAILESLPTELQMDAEVNRLMRGIPNQRAYHSTLARISPTGSDYRDIPSMDYAAAPDWNEAGIVYQSNAGIQRTADEGDARSVLVANDALLGYFHDPAWQPNGGRIVFHRKQGSHWQIYAVNPDGSALVALTRPVTALVDELPSNVSPTWSPDGQHILYLSNRNSIESAGAWHLWIMNADGSEQRMLPIDVVLEYTFSSEQMISWGPSVQ